MRSPNFQQLRTNGITVRAVVEGSGPLCILVHGWPESWYSWRHQIAPLVAAGYRVCVPDVRGYGGSDKPDAVEDYDLASLSADVVGLIDALGAEQAILIGHDWGAPIIWATSILHRERVRAAIGLSVPHFGRGAQPTIDTLRMIYQDRFFYQIYFQEPGVAERELEADVRSALRKIYFGGSGDLSDAARGSFSQRPASAGMLDGMTDPPELPAWLSEQDLDYYTGEFERSGFRGPINRYRNYRRDWTDLPQLGERISQPALYVTGTRDPVLHFMPGFDVLAFITPLYEDLRGKITIEGVGHWTQQERPEAVNQAILEFLRGL
jgi:pimeloyl-ACP methyl ester carboxylesterase